MREYGRLTLVTAPTVEPCTTADVKEYLRVESGVTTDDNLIAALLKAVRKHVESLYSLAIMTQTWDWFLDSAPGPELVLPLRPVASITGVFFTDTDGTEGAAVDSSKYTLDTAGARHRIVLNDGESWGHTGLRTFKGTRVRFVAGYGATAASGDTAGSAPEDLVLAIKRIVLHHYENREQVSSGGMTEIPQAAAMLLNNYWIPRL